MRKRPARPAVACSRSGPLRPPLKTPRLYIRRLGRHGMDDPVKDQGIGKMVTFRFDLTCAVLAHRNDRGPDFLVHDSRGSSTASMIWSRT